jgi:hypothetical protein
MNSNDKKQIHIDSRITAQDARLRSGGTREHGNATPNTPNYFARRVGALLLVASTVAGVGAALTGVGEAEGDNTPTPTTIVKADQSGVWGAVETELEQSGYRRDSEDSSSRITNEMVRDLTDDAVKLNEAANPNFNSQDLQPNQSIIVVDVPPPENK